MNNWYVITGGPCSGKTTTLNFLAKKGYRVTDEMARVYIDQEIKKGRKLDQIRTDEGKFQKHIVKMKIALEKTLPRKQAIFLDRGIPDSVAYYKLLGVGIDSFLKKALVNCSYKKVFVLELLDYQKDYARTESPEQARQIENLLISSYLSLGMEVIKVPVMSATNRVKFILRLI